MAKCSRRQFLQLAGISFMARSFGSLPHIADLSDTIPELTMPHGRALRPVTVHTRPHSSAPAVRQLWPDVIVPLVGEQGGWYRVQGGYVPRDALQPISLSAVTEPMMIPALPFWGEVTAPATAIRQWCAADAPLMTRIGHGGTARIVDSLPATEADGPSWYGIGDQSGGILGWSQASHWQPAPMPEAEAALQLIIERERQRIIVFAGERPVVQAAISIGETLSPGSYPLCLGPVAGAPLRLVEYDSTLLGAPWQLVFGSTHTLSGVYWHNLFGRPADGPAVQITPVLARWLYRHSGPESTIAIQ